ncbi:ATP-binding protein [Kitasatospora sp. NPDC052896]|uniref:ATP-binding protein n=1 Tax=Kitasatospora sp. NPDC052896 TaxID=3364061 RepID=UPI0037CC922D
MVSGVRKLSVFALALGGPVGGVGLHSRRTIEVVPGARRTLSSLRNLGYKIHEAVADVVDNSISADAERVDITLRFDGPHSWIRIADNGRGMDARQLTEAFRYGSERDYERADLGRYGFGLKAASTSQCRRLTVVSLARSAGATVEAFQLDLDHVERVNSWEIFHLDPERIPQAALEGLGDGPGTVVLWEDLDRLLQYSDPFGKWAQKQMYQCAQEIDEHLALVFHRFLAGEVPEHTLEITVNDTRVEPWDPFCRAEPNTVALPEEHLEVNSRDGNGIVRLRPFILPAQQQFSSQPAWKKASGPKNWNRQQGFYVYRADRIIQFAGWHRLRGSDEHTKLARVSLEFHRELDGAFGVEVSKASVTLPRGLRDELAQLVPHWTQLADRVYRRKERPAGSPPHAQAKRTSSPAPTPQPRPAASVPPPGRLPQDHTASTNGSAVRTGPPQQTTTRTALEQAAKQTGDTAALQRILAVVRSNNPEIVRVLGW